MGDTSRALKARRSSVRKDYALMVPARIRHTSEGFVGGTVSDVRILIARRLSTGKRRRGLFESFATRARVC